MDIIIKFNDDDQITVNVDNNIIDELNSEYPEVGMMNAMEECNELAIALSKCIRNGNEKKRENLAEEIIDVLSVIQWAIRRFGITASMLQRWNDEKSIRLVDRHKHDEVIFRNPEAKSKYDATRVIPPDSKEDNPGSTNTNTVKVDTGTSVFNLDDIPTQFIAQDSTDKVSKRTAKDLDKLVSKAIKSSKKTKKSDKKDSKKDKKDKKDKKSDKKGKGKK